MRIGVVLASLKKDIETDPEIQKYVSSIVLQSRLKTAPSAFKKMVKGAKRRDELFDLLGLRIIITERQDDDFEDDDCDGEDVQVDITDDEKVTSSKNDDNDDDMMTVAPSSAKQFREKQAIYRMEVLLNRSS